MKWLFLGFFICLNFVFAPLRAQDFWEQSRGPEGNQVYALLADVNGYMFVSGPGGIFRSDDRGLHWTISGGDLFRQSTGLPMTVGRDNVLYAGNLRAGIHRSLNDGATWQRLSDADTRAANIHKLIVTSQGRMFARGKAIFRSDNGGQNWDRISISPVNNPVLDIVLTNSEILISAVDAEGIYRSSQAAESWVKTKVFSRNARFQQLTRDSRGTLYALVYNSGHAARSTELFISSDEGATWRSGLKIDLSDEPSFVVAHPDRGIVVGFFDGDDASLYISRDRGDSWQKHAVELTPRERRSFHLTNILHATFDASGTLFAGTSNGVYRSTNDGISFIPSQSGLVNASTSLLAFHPDGSLFAASLWNSTVFRSGDEGQSWDPVEFHIGADFNNGQLSNGIRGLAIQAGKAVVVGTFSDIYRSPDGSGASWESLNFNGGGVASLVVNRRNELLVATHRDGIWRFAEEEKRWHSLNVGFTVGGTPHKLIYWLHASPMGQLFAASYTASIPMLIRSTDDGTSWHNVYRFATFPEFIDHMASNADGVTLVVKNDDIYRSQDFGTTWTQLKVPFESDVIYSQTRLAADGRGKFYISTGDAGIYQSDDFGDNWRRTPGPNPLFVLQIACSPQGRMFAATYYNGVYRQTLAVAGIESPAQQNAGSPPPTLHISPNPLRERATFSIGLHKDSHFTLKVFDLHGRSIATIAEGVLPAGQHNYSWEPFRSTQAVYYCELLTESARKIQQILLVK